MSSASARINSGFSKVRKARSALREARSVLRQRLDAARKAAEASTFILKAARLLSSSSTVKAPASGVIRRLTASTGEAVYPGQPLAVITPDRSLYFDLELPTDFHRELKKGSLIYLKADGSTATARAIVSRLSDEVELAPSGLETDRVHLLRTLTAVLHIEEDPQTILKAGQPADAYLSKGES